MTLMEKCLTAFLALLVAACMAFGMAVLWLNATRPMSTAPSCSEVRRAP